MKYAIAVTQEDIDNGLHENSSSCPVALAISTTLNKKVCVQANSGHIHEKESPIGTQLFLLPERVEKFIVSFDAHLYVEPFSFTLEV